MADKIVSLPDGSTLNLGDPDNSDARYTSGQGSLYLDAQEALSKVSFLEKLYMKTHAGPQTLAYYKAMEDVAASQKVYGFLPTPPDKYED